MSADSSRVLVWDWAVRLFHWLAVLLFVLMWWTAENWIMDWHRRIGMMLVGLLTFRIVWGLIGPPSARFAAMIAGPGAILAYIRTLLSGGHKASAGHNPLGTLSVFAILVALCTQVGTGLFAVDVDGLESARSRASSRSRRDGRRRRSTRSASTSCSRSSHCMSSPSSPILSSSRTTSSVPW